MTKKIFLFGVAMLAVWQLGAARDLYKVTVSADGEKTVYALSSVQKIVFESSTMTVHMKAGGDATNVTCVGFALDLSGIDYSQLKLNEVSGVGGDGEKFYELINIGTEDIPLVGCKIYYNANGSSGDAFPPADNRLTWTGSDTQTAKAGELFSLIGRGTPGSFTTGLTAQRILIITLEDPAGNVIDQCIRAEDTDEYAFTDKSFSRIPDGTVPFYFTEPTPNELNGEDATDLVLVPQTQGNVEIKKQKADASISIFPNPVQSYLTVNGADKGVNISVLGLSGAVLQTLPAQENTTRINVSALPQGMYILQIGDQYIKFIKQ